MVKDKIKEWVKRYAPAEVVAICTALLGAGLFHLLFRNSITTALAGTWGENLGYYSVIIWQDTRRQSRDRRATGERYRAQDVLLLIRNLVIEFGPGEYLDSFIIRPGCMYLFPRLTGNVMLGIAIGKIVADVIFYIPTIIAYEVRKKYLHTL
ncbi:MAG TPA: hypothetical protein PKL83_00455 [bacterium]|nr:hypothetical protein [bacterium]